MHPDKGAGTKMLTGYQRLRFKDTFSIGANVLSFLLTGQGNDIKTFYVYCFLLLKDLGLLWDVSWPLLGKETWMIRLRWT